MACKVETMTTHALEDVPLRTRSILGDLDINPANFVDKLRNFPKVSSGAYEFYAGVYINIVSRLWNVKNSDNNLEAGETQHQLYYGATNASNSGSRIRGHRNHLGMTLSENKAAFAAIKKTVPYHYEFGCQPDSPESSPGFKSHTDFRSLGHVSAEDPTKTAWPWLRELVNQILFNMMPTPESTFRCHWYTTEVKELVQKIRSELEKKSGILPDLSSVSLNRGCALREMPRLGRNKHRGTCVSCPRIYAPGSFHTKKEAPWQARFRLVEPGNPFRGIICAGCYADNSPEGHKLCRSCDRHRPLEAFGGRKRCRACAKKQRAYRRRSKQRAKNGNAASSDDDKLELSSRDEFKQYR